MLPDYETAAIKACETLIKHQVLTAPVAPLPILKAIPGVIVVSFAEMAERVGMDRGNVIGMFDPENHDAATAVYNKNGRLHYIVVYNQRLPFYMLQRALARELGHIVIGHDGSLPEDVRMAEAVTFARHLLCPRPLVQALRDAGLTITVEMLGNVTGCYERCLAGLRKSPGVNVPPELNRLLRDQFTDYVVNFVDCQTVLSGADESAVADFGTYMDNYRE